MVGRRYLPVCTLSVALAKGAEVLSIRPKS